MLNNFIKSIMDIAKTYTFKLLFIICLFDHSFVRSFGAFFSLSLQLVFYFIFPLKFHFISNKFFSARFIWLVVCWFPLITVCSMLCYVAIIDKNEWREEEVTKKAQCIQFLNVLCLLMILTSYRKNIHQIQQPMHTGPFIALCVVCVIVIYLNIHLFRLIHFLPYI